MNCPKCKKAVEQTGVLTIDGQDAPVYQCETCVSDWLFGGKVFEAAFTFCVINGQFFSPDTMEPIHLN